MARCLNEFVPFFLLGGCPEEIYLMILQEVFGAWR